MAKQTPTKKANKKTAAKTSVATEKKTTETKKVAVSAPAKVKSLASSPVSKLARWYKGLGVVLLLEGIAVAALGHHVSAPLTMQYPALDTLASEANGHQVVALANRHVWDVHMAWLVATFLLVFAVINLMMATLYRPQLEASLKRGVNAFRWFALGLGGGLMIVAIALISGISSLALLSLLFAATFAASLLALGAETMVTNSGGVKSRFSHLLCGLAVVFGALPWVVFGLGLLGAVLWGGHVPSYLYSIYICQFVLFVAVLLAVHFRLKRQGGWGDALYTDRGFLLLSFVAATLLAAQTFAGVLK